MKKVLIIQTAFIGDVILATALIESIAQHEGEWQIDFLLRKGNESLLKDHPHLNKVLVWNKKEQKYKNLIKLTKEVKTEKYDVILNLQRFASSGYICFKSKAKVIAGFEKNPFSFKFHHKINHQIGEGSHEIDRNFELLKSIGDFELKKPKLYPSPNQCSKVDSLSSTSDFVVMAPSSVWFTKQLPKTKWIELCDHTSENTTIYLIGGGEDVSYLSEIKSGSKHPQIQLMAGKLNLLESAYLISKSTMTFVNDSAPLHLASAMNAPVTAFFCSTVPDFGFGPLSDQNRVIQIDKELECRPCGLHGKKSCPKGHFDCGLKIDVTQLN
ncbi:MAG: glycosyltransferase family 9 protein [Crocinitomicaceae bacterium]